MSEMSDMHKLIMAMKLAKTAQVGLELTYFDVIELLGELDSLKDYIAELEAGRKWIPVSERLPEDRATVLVAFTEYPEQIDILTATYYKRYEGFGGIDNWWDIEGWHSGNVTHWMPLPESPKERER